MIRRTALVLLCACGGEDIEPERDARVEADAGLAAFDAGPDAADPGPPPPGAIVADDICLTDGEPPIALSNSGAFVAYVACREEQKLVIVRDVFGPSEFVIAAGEPDYTFQFSPDDEYVVFGNARGTYLRRIYGLGPMPMLASVPTIGIVFVDRPSGLMILVVTRNGEYVVVAAFDESSAEPFGVRRVLADGSDLAPAMPRLDDALSSMIVEASSTYYRVATAGSLLMPIAFGPDDARLAGGIGPTHALAFAGDTLVYRSLTDESAVEVLGAGVVAGDDARFFVHAGDVYFATSTHMMKATLAWPTRGEILRPADIVGMVPSPDFDRIVYATPTTLESMTPTGSSAALLLEASVRAPFAPVISPTSRQVAVVIDDGRIALTPIDEPGGARIIDAAPIDAEIAFDGLGDALRWREASDAEGHRDVLREVPAFVGTPYTIAWDVAAYFRIPGSSDAIFVTRGPTHFELRRLE